MLAAFSSGRFLPQTRLKPLIHVFHPCYKLKTLLVLLFGYVVVDNLHHELVKPLKCSVVPAIF
jgi:hypothetical protein